MNFQVIDLQNPLWMQTLQRLRHDIYHLPEYVDLEARRTKTTPEAILIADDDKLFFLPYLLRNCNDIFEQKLTTKKIFDTVSPYGYPGILLSEAAASTPEFIEFVMNKLMRVWSDKQVCSAFLRLHPILNHGFNEICQPGICNVNGETVSVDLKLSESEIWSNTKRDHRNKINRCRRAGLTARMVPFEQYIDEFVVIYKATMERVKASKSYFSFDYGYFLDLRSALGEKLHLCIVEGNEQIVSAGLYTECCGIVQAILGGTRTKYVKLSPSSLETDFARLWAKKRGNEVFHLGGGVGGSKDSLYTFKAGFSRQRHSFLTLRLITDDRKYQHLVELRAKTLNIQVEELLKSNFFPAYRLYNSS